jgi:hypothetical protein
MGNMAYLKCHISNHFGCDPLDAASCKQVLGALGLLVWIKPFANSIQLGGSLVAE